MSNETELRAALEACLHALNTAPRFTFHPGANPLALPMKRGASDSYALASAVTAALAVDLIAGDQPNTCPNDGARTEALEQRANNTLERCLDCGAHFVFWQP